jgi:DNA-binding transcriptional LysR family regulator
MNIELRQLRCLIAIAEAGSFTDAAIDLGISQAAASRTLASLESALGVRLLRRTTREVTLTAAGSRVLAHARRALAAADDVVREAAAGPARLRIGYAWSAMGRHTTPFQRRWAAEHPDIELQLIRTNSASAGLAEGACDIAVIRTEPDQHRFRDAIVGLERRYCAMAADDPWAARRSLRLAEISERVLVIDRRTGTTTRPMAAGSAPGHRVHRDIDDWLTAIATGRYVGVTPESTVTQYPRPGIAFRPLRDAPPVPVRLVWWRDEAHPATAAAVGLLTSLFRYPAR